MSSTEIFLCPVCGYPELEERPWTDSIGSLDPSWRQSSVVVTDSIEPSELSPWYRTDGCVCCGVASGAADGSLQ